MSDETPQPGAEDTPTPEPAAEETPKPEGKTFDEAYVKQLREEAAKYRTRAKELEDAQKSEDEKRAERLAELEGKVKEYETREQITAWKAETVDALEGLTADQKATLTKALAGSTKEEIEAHAETLKSLIAPPAADPEPTKPGAVAGIAKTPSGPQATTIQQQIAAAEAAGEHALVAALKAASLGTT